MISLASQLVPLESNFLVPNATFFVELAAFALLFYLLAKYVIPPINRAMVARQDAIRKEFADLEHARSEAEAAEAEYKAQIADARHEAARIREEARQQGAQITAEMREQAQTEAARIVENGAHPDRGRAPAGRDVAPRRGRHAGHHPRRAHRRREPRRRRAQHARGRPLPG